jgi:hypothetical protein
VQQICQDDNLSFTVIEKLRWDPWQCLALYSHSILSNLYISDFKFFNQVIEFRYISKQLNCCIHVAGVSNVDETVTLRDGKVLLNIHSFLNFRQTSLLQLFTSFGAHYYQSASLCQCKETLVILSFKRITLIIFALNRIFKFLGGISVSANTFAWKS